MADLGRADGVRRDKSMVVPLTRSGGRQMPLQIGQHPRRRLEISVLAFHDYPTLSNDRRFQTPALVNYPGFTLHPNIHIHIES